MPIACPSSQKIETLAYLTQVEAVVGLGPSIRLGFNPGELLDFILGWVTLDIFNDDLNSAASLKAIEIKKQQAEKERRLHALALEKRRQRQLHPLTLEQRRQLRDAYLKNQEKSNNQMQNIGTNAPNSDL